MGEFHVGTLLLPVGVADHECGLRIVRDATSLDHQRPHRADEFRTASAAGPCQRRVFYPSDVAAVLDAIDTAGREQCLQVDVLVGMSGRVVSTIDTSCAIHNAVHVGAREIGALPHQRRCQRPNVEPTPTWHASAAVTATPVVEIVPIDIHTHSHDRTVRAMSDKIVASDGVQRARVRSPPDDQRRVGVPASPSRRAAHSDQAIPKDKAILVLRGQGFAEPKRMLLCSPRTPGAGIGLESLGRRAAAGLIEQDRHHGGGVQDHQRPAPLSWSGAHGRQLPGACRSSAAGKCAAQVSGTGRRDSWLVIDRSAEEEPWGPQRTPRRLSCWPADTSEDLLVSTCARPSAWRSFSPCRRPAPGLPAGPAALPVRPLSAGSGRTLRQPATPTQNPAHRRKESDDHPYSGAGRQQGDSQHHG